MKKTMIQWLAVPIAFIVVACVSSILDAQTIWEKRDQEKAFLFEDLKARRVGDLLSVMINERTDVANADNRALNKQTSMDAGTNFGYGGSGAGGSFNAALDGNSERNFNGGTTFSSDREFTDRFSVVVLDILPNGNMLVAGKRLVMVEGDTKQLTLTGIVRSHDIRGDNSVLSQQVAEMSIQFEGTGVESTTVNQGWLNKKLNRIWPF